MRQSGRGEGALASGNTVSLALAPIRGLWLGQHRAFGEPEAGGRQVPAPRLQSVPLSKKRGVGEGVRPWRRGPWSPTSTGMAYPRWQLLGGHKEGRPCWRTGDSEGWGQGQGHRVALAGWKASPLSGPSLSWGVGKEGPRGRGWPLNG